MGYGKSWTDEEVEMIMTSPKSDKELGEILGRTARSVYMKRFYTNYKRNHGKNWIHDHKETSKNVNNGKPWTDEEKEMILKKEKNDKELAKILGRSLNTIRAMRYHILYEQRTGERWFDHTWTNSRYESRKEYRLNHVEERNQYRAKNYNKSRKNAHNSHQHWTDEDLELIWNHDVSDMELSEVLGRSVQAIQAQRCKLKKIEEAKKHDC